MSGTAAPPWLTSLDTLDEIPKDGAGRVVVTDPDAPDGVDLGKVLRRSLLGHTHTFVAIVGYFAHRGTGSEGLSDPAALVAAELKDESDRDVDDSRPRFQLLYGALCSHESRRALRAWYFVCLWRHGGRDNTADAWRRDALAALKARRGSVAEFARSLFRDGDTCCPLLTKAAVDWFLPEVQDDFQDWQRNHGMDRDPVAASLFLYCLQRCAEIRFGRKKGNDIKQVRVFHPKLYVIERTEDGAPETIVVAGSGNWSAPALAATNEGGANIEMGVVFRSSGHAWSAPERRSIAHELAAAGLDMYHHARSQILASWTDYHHPSPEEARLALEVLTRSGTTPTTETHDEDTPVEEAEDRSLDPTDSTTLQLRYAIQRLIEQSLLLNPDDTRTVAAMLDAARDAWGSKVPSGYQIDGAVRLLQILKTSRGAMLTDEPGLGKTLIAQLTVAALVKKRIAQRVALRPGAAVPPVRVTIVAPARVLGTERQRDEPTQWFLYATEIRRAVQKLLAVDPELAAHAEVWADEKKLVIRPLSVTSFGRKIAGDAEARKDILDDLIHVAASDIVVLDEAHNFRNGTSRATRVLRFCLSLPACGEVGWRPRSGTEQETVGQPWSAERGRKILLLTATPFNNNIGDIHAQVGHFAKAQTWDGLRKALAGRRKGKGRGKGAKDIADGIDDALEQAIGKRVEAAPELGDPYWESDESRLHMSTLLRMCAAENGELAAHFESSRALDLNAENLTRQGEKGIDATTRAASDTGPVYNWGVAPFSSELNTLFRVVTEALEQHDDVRDPSTAAAGDASARAQIDFFLSAFVVQRSRRQIIDELHRSKDEVAQTMFRDPFQPRRPRRLAVIDGESDRDSRDRAFLDSLYEVFRPASEAEGGAARISLEAYRIRYMRGFTGQQRNAGRVANFIGFQAMTLIKRLQSSPYAFMRTLARGFVLTSLLELALVEELLDRRGRATGQDFMSLLRRTESEVKRSRSKVAAAQAQLQEFLLRVADGLVVAKQRIMEAAFGESDKQGDEQNATFVVHLLRGESQGDVSKRAINLGVKSDDFFRKLCSLGSDQPAASRTRREAFDAAVEAGEALLEAGLGAKDGSWLGDLLGGVIRAVKDPLEAGVVFDACEGLKLLFAGEGLANELYEHLVDVRGRDMAGLVTTMRTLRSQQVSDWVTSRLDKDERLASLVAFVLLHVHTAQTSGGLVAGDRALVFTEYGDTLEYIRAVLTGLYVLGTNEELIRAPKLPGWANSLLKKLRAAVRALAPSGWEPGDVVADGGAAPFTRDDVERFIAFLHDKNKDRVLAFLASLGQEVAVISANHDGGRRLGDLQPAKFDDAETDDEAALAGESPRAEAAAGTIGGAPILDAFSPFYQIDLPTLNADNGLREPDLRAERPRKRLEAALASPVRVLLATEVLAEGVNLQQAGILIHYDLPWNPTRLIQRNGRVDRRINALVESHDDLKNYLEKLRVADPKTAAASYVVPRHVFHFTVPPIEGTALDAEAARERAQRVRAVLAAKLDNIRRILGLSSWPVVLDQRTASAVLDGSLEYETPSLVRRERLLQRVRQLDDSINPKRSTLAHAGTITLRISRDELAKLAETIAGEQADWSRLRALLLTTWSPHYPQSVPLRSEHEWAVATHKEKPRDIGGMMPILVFADNIVSWISQSYNQGSKTYKKALLPVSWEYRQVNEQKKLRFAYIDPVALKVSPQLSLTDAMTSPAALFDTALEWLAGLAMSEPETRIGSCTVDLPSEQPWGWLGGELSRHPPTVNGVEVGNIGAALRRPHGEMAQRASLTVSEGFSLDELKSFNLVIVPA